MMNEISSAVERIASVYRRTDSQVPRTVLLVDDEESIRQAIGKFLRSRGYAVTVAGGGGEALDALFRERFDAMVCDVRMPEMTGLEVVPNAIEASPDIAIVMLTAVNDAPTVTEALALGALDYLMKPVELDLLVDSIERALQKRGAEVQQRHVERVIREEFAIRTGNLSRTQEVLAEALAIALGDMAPEFAAEKLERLASGRIAVPDMDLIRRILANRKPSPRHGEGR